MTIQVNGEAFLFESGSTLVALLEAYGVTGDRIAVTVNEEVVPRLRREEKTIQDGDQVEILTFAGGG
ncbi:MAG: sulfur carrier protein ThiS [Kiritimatiellae bacterium]|nr:sulfur carrier protein ThiS [Kiritimatiellia bacterium]